MIGKILKTEKKYVGEINIWVGKKERMRAQKN